MKHTHFTNVAKMSYTVAKIIPVGERLGVNAVDSGLCRKFTPSFWKMNDNFRS